MQADFLLEDPQAQFIDLKIKENRKNFQDRPSPLEFAQIINHTILEDRQTLAAKGWNKLLTKKGEIIEANLLQDPNRGYLTLVVIIPKLYLGVDIYDKYNGKSPDYQLILDMIKLAEDMVIFRLNDCLL